MSLGGDCSGTGNPINCAYFLDALPLPTNVPDLTTSYQSDMLDFFNADLANIVSSDTVITSMILEPDNNDFAVSWMQTPASTGFTYALDTLAVADLQAFATQQGAAGRVITAGVVRLFGRRSGHLLRMAIGSSNGVRSKSVDRHI